MLVPWLLKYDGYPPGVVVAVLLHGILMYVFMPKEFEPADQVTVQPAAFVMASTATQSPQRLRRIERERSQAQQAENERRTRERAAAEERRIADERRQQAAAEEERRVSEERRRQAAAEEEQRVAEERRQQAAADERRREEERRRQDAAAAEQRRLDAARAEAALTAATVEGQMVSQYMALIMQLISDNWSRPPSATNGMTAVVLLRLVPTGEVVESTIIQSSGNDAFDRSVTQAIARVGSFEFEDMPTAVFERNFRNFTVTFRPEDLLR